MNISLFNIADKSAVIDHFTQVFSDSEGKTEGALIGDLVSNLIATTDKDDLIGFVASNQEQIVGCIFFSRLLLPNKQSAFLLSPVAISTSEQGKGVGQKLINEGLDHLKTLNIDLVITYGDPNFYSKVDFQQITEEIIKAPFNLSHPHGWLAQSLNGKPFEKISGTIQCVDAFNDQRYW